MSDARGSWFSIAAIRSPMVGAFSCGACGEVIIDGHSCPAIYRGYEQGRQEVTSQLRVVSRHPHKGPDDTDASMLRAAASRAAQGYVVGGSHTSATVAKVLRLVADLLDYDERTLPAGGDSDG